MADWPNSSKSSSPYKNDNFISNLLEPITNAENNLRTSSPDFADQIPDFDVDHASSADLTKIVIPEYTISIRERMQFYSVELEALRGKNIAIESQVTFNPSTVDTWVPHMIKKAPRREDNSIVVGLHISHEGTPQNPEMSILALTVGDLDYSFCSCLLFQIKLAEKVPQSLKDFLSLDIVRIYRGGYDHLEGGFSGLLSQFGIEVPLQHNVSNMAAISFKDQTLQTATIEEVAKLVAGIDCGEDQLMGRADIRDLHPSHIKYATVCSFAVMLVGERLHNPGKNDSCH